MQVSYKWLCSLVPTLTATAHELEEKMSTTGIEVEGVTPPAEDLSKLVVGEIISAEDIPETHLHVCQVSVGGSDLLQIVCGAPNVAVGNKAIVALVGARIKDRVKIKKGKIRGYESQGMLCALDELGVADSINPMKHEEGIYVLPADSVVGESIFPLLDMDDELIELSITPNRADALSMRGVAYEVGAIYDLPVTFPRIKLTEAEKSAADVIKVSVSSDKVPTYKIRVIENVKVAPSPLWLQNRLMNAGIRPINNIVDVTNYILMDYGQPLHAFDFEKLGSDEIVVRQAKEGEKLTTLDNVARALSPSDTVITSNGAPIALAGVMGGLDSEITNETTTVALEAALFNPSSVRKTSQKFALRSEASSRFEKGINQATVREALDAAAALIAELAGGKVLFGVVESNSYQPEEVQVSITLERLNHALGTDLTTKEVTKIFDRLGFVTEISNETSKLTSAHFADSQGSDVFAEDTQLQGTTFVETIPSRRWDIAIEADLVEEVARIYGYDRLPSTLPETGSSIGSLNPLQHLERNSRTQLEASGLSEVIGYSLTTSEKAIQFTEQATPTTSLMLPMTEDHAVLRQNLITGLLDNINYNQNRKNNDVAIYELGKIFTIENPEQSQPTEHLMLAFALSGNVLAKRYDAAAVPVDFYHAKGIVEKLLAGYEDVRFEATDKIQEMHPGRTARVQVVGETIGFIGQVHPETCKRFDIRETYVATLSLEALLSYAPAQLVFEEIPKFPAVTRDIALLLPEATSHAAVLDIIQSSNVKTLINVELFDIYSGDKLPKGKKSMAYSLTFQNRERTLTDEDVTAAVRKICTALTEQLGAEIR